MVCSFARDLPGAPFGGLRLPSGQRCVSAGERVAPSGPRRETFVPANDLGERSAGKPHALGRWDDPPKEKIGDRETLADEPGLAFQRLIEHGREPGEVLLAARDEGGVRRTETKHRFRAFLESD